MTRYSCAYIYAYALFVASENHALVSSANKVNLNDCEEWHTSFETYITPLRFVPLEKGFECFLVVAVASG